MEKSCIACGKTLPITEFYRHPMMKDGHLNKCKECCKRQGNERRAAKLEEFRRYEKQRAKTPKRKAAALALVRKMRKLYPEKNKARASVCRAVRSGKIVPQPCAICGATKTEAHHTDYSKPLDVMWVCRSCHFKLHYGGGVPTTRSRRGDCCSGAGRAGGAGCNE